MKETKKQVKAQLTNEIAKQYAKREKSLKEYSISLEKRYNCAMEHMRKLENENIELKDKVEQYEDWIRRLLEFMDMTPEEREKYFAELQTRNKLNEKMTSFMTMFQHLGLYI